MGSRRAEKETISVYIVSNNNLAGKYLVHIIGEDRRIKPTLCKALPRPDTNPSNTIFILDSSSGLYPFSELLRRLQQRYPRSKIIVVNGARSAAELVELLELGVQGFVDQNDVSEGLCEAIHTVALGRLSMPNQIIESYFETIANRKLRRPDNLLHRGRRIRQRDIITYAAIEENILLQHNAGLASQPRRIGKCEINAIDENAATLRHVKSLNQLRERALS